MGTTLDVRYECTFPLAAPTQVDRWMDNLHLPAQILPNGRTVFYVGMCVACERHCWRTKRMAYDLAEHNVIRALLGPWAGTLLEATDYGKEGPDINLCTACKNDFRQFNKGLERAGTGWLWPGEEEDDE